ncbi:aminotransferase class I/II-fold pyridoxal phosphate-dependent enzyme [Streptomyces sp. NBC_01231]|nr:aminotransferase class I/II-fold pyridoxal phosphate-dependent enzyme [Streptomyces sp. NBC_01231]
MADTNTALERAAINSGLNLSDAHARAPLGPLGSAIITNLGSVFRRAEGMFQADAERELVSAFERLGSFCFPRRPQISYSSSALVSVIANYLRQEHCRVHLLDPCFDNIRDLLSTAGIELLPISESSVNGLRDRPPVTLPGDVLWLTSPSNPTGWVLAEDEYRRTAEYCAANDALLVVDHCFRFFSPTTRSFDQYRLLESIEGLDYIVLEDTGKTTALLDIKVGMAVSSESIVDRFQELNEEFLLNVSPFSCLLISEALDALANGDLENHLIPLVQSNRSILLDAFQELLPPTATVDEESEVPLLWVDTGLPQGGRKLARYLREHGIHILPGDRFYSDQTDGNGKVRVALFRHTESISDAVAQMPRSVGLWYEEAVL